MRPTALWSLRFPSQPKLSRPDGNDRMAQKRTNEMRGVDWLPRALVAEKPQRARTGAVPAPKGAVTGSPGRTATSAGPTSAASRGRQQGQGGIAGQLTDTAIDPGRRPTGEETGINRDTAQRTIGDVSGPQQETVPFGADQQGAGKLAMAPGGRCEVRAGQREAGRAGRARRRPRASWPALFLSWPHTSGLSQRPAFLRRTMEARQPSSSGPCCLFSSASSLARGRGTGCPHHPLDLDGFPRAAATSAEGQQSRARCQTPMARLFTEPVAGKGPAHIAYGETP